MSRGGLAGRRRPVPPPASRGLDRAGAPVLAAAVLLLGAAIVGGCDPGTSAPGSGSPAGSAAGASPSQDGATPQPTWWPASVVESVLALAATDGEIAKAGADLTAAAQAEDLEQMLGAADGLAQLIEAVTPNVDRIEGYPETAALATSYRAAFPAMLEGATQIRDAIRAGDAAGLTAGSARLAAGLQAYAETRRLLGPAANQAVFMKRQLVK